MAAVLTEEVEIFEIIFIEHGVAHWFSKKYPWPNVDM